jgi:hypothetical protein
MSKQYGSARFRVAEKSCLGSAVKHLRNKARVASGFPKTQPEWPVRTQVVSWEFFCSGSKEFSSRVVICGRHGVNRPRVHHACSCEVIGPLRVWRLWSSHTLQVYAAEMSEEAERARKFAERLVEYDRSAARRSTVIDDQGDFFEVDSNAWLTPEERDNFKKQQALQEQLERQRRDKVTVSIDLLGREVRLCRAQLFTHSVHFADSWSSFPDE